MLRIALRWLHLLAAVAWVGGALFYLLVLSPASRGAPDPWRASMVAAVQARYRELVEASIVVLVVTGTVLTFDRLSGPGSSVPYALVLALKVVLALWMFYLAYRMAHRRRGGDTARRGHGDGEGEVSASPRPRVPASRDPAAPRLLLALGVTVLLLAVALRTLYGGS